MVLRQSFSHKAFTRHRSSNISNIIFSIPYYYDNSRFNHEKNFNTTEGICKSCQTGAYCSENYRPKNRKRKQKPREISCFKKVTPNMSFNFQDLG